MWPCTPLTTSLPLKVPRRPFLIMSPQIFTEVGSPTMHQSKRCFFLVSQSQTATVPWVAGPSSSLVNKKATENAGFLTRA